MSTAAVAVGDKGFLAVTIYPGRVVRWPVEVESIPRAGLVSLRTLPHALPEGESSILLPTPPSVLYEEPIVVGEDRFER